MKNNQSNNAQMKRWTTRKATSSSPQLLSTHSTTHLHALKVQQIDILLHLVERERDLDAWVGRVCGDGAPGLLAAAPLACPALKVGLQVGLRE